MHAISPSNPGARSIGLFFVLSCVMNRVFLCLVRLIFRSILGMWRGSLFLMDMRVELELELSEE